MHQILAITANRANHQPKRGHPSYGNHRPRPLAIRRNELPCPRRPIFRFPNGPKTPVHLIVGGYSRHRLVLQPPGKPSSIDARPREAADFSRIQRFCQKTRHQSHLLKCLQPSREWPRRISRQERQKAIPTVWQRLAKVR